MTPILTLSPSSPIRLRQRTSDVFDNPYTASFKNHPWTSQSH
jgi:hypothetical protein